MYYKQQNKERSRKMKKRKRTYFIIGGIVLLIMLLMGYGLFATCGPWGGSRCGFHPRFHGRGFHPGFNSKDFGEFILWRMDKKVVELDLTDAQKEKYEAIKGNIQRQLEEGRADRKRIIEKFHAEINKEDPDVKALAETLKKKIEGISGFMEENLDLFVEFYEALDDAQKDRVIDAIRERMEHHHS
jgi:Spy/CpxP family protein refolding chaperone